MPPYECFSVLVLCFLWSISPVHLVTVVHDGPKENRNVLDGTTIDDEQVSNGFKTVNTYWTTSRRDRTTGEDFEGLEETSTEGRECSRYCIERSTEGNDNVQYVNLFWSANGENITDNFSLKDYVQLNISEFRRIDTTNFNTFLKNCQIYLDLDCNNEEKESARNYVRKEFFPGVKDNSRNIDSSSKLSNNLRSFDSVKLLDRSDLSRYTKTTFFVNNSMSRIIIDINGNVSSALFQIPTVFSSETTISLARKNNAEGVRIDTRNAPAGEWCVKLTGVENSKYRITVEAFVQKNTVESNLFFPEAPVNGKLNEISSANYNTNIGAKTDMISDSYNVFTEVRDPQEIASDKKDWSTIIASKLHDHRKTTHERSLDREEGDQTIIADSNDANSLVVSSTTEDSTVNYVERVYFPTDETNITILQDSSNAEQWSDITEEQQKIRPRSSIGYSESIDASNNKIMTTRNANMSMKLTENLEGQELSEEFTNYVKEDSIEKKRMLIDVNRNSNLLVTPGTIHRVVFDVMNSCILPVRYAFGAKTSPFRLYNIQPNTVWVYPGQTGHVAVDLVIPSNSAQDTANTLTLSIQGSEIKEKTVYLYVQGSVSKITDNIKPTIEYSFNDNCAGKLDKNRCYKTRWSADITIQDYDSGLKRVISSTNEIYPRTEFVSGTRNPITFYYSATCCDTTVEISAIDLLDNYHTRTIDVTVWNNLSDAEIAAITVGALLILLFIILLVIIIIYCVSRKKSHDLPYTQRYGSRPSAQAQRTSF